MGSFLSKSVEIYAKHKLRGDDVTKGVTEDLGDLLTVLSSQASGKDKEAIQAEAAKLKENLGEYVNKMDSSLTKARDNLLVKKGITAPKPRQLDDAMKQVAQSNGYKSAGEALLSGKKISMFSSGMCKICAWVYDKIGNSDKANEYRAQAQVMDMRKSLKQVTSNEKGTVDEKTPLLSVSVPYKSTGHGRR